MATNNIAMPPFADLPPEFELRQACGVCSDTAPDVFELSDKAIVKAGADLKKNEDLIVESAEGCPVNVIAIENDNSGKRDN